jgi:beta-galactosidase
LRKSSLLCIAVLIVLTASLFAQGRRIFASENGQLELDGKPYRILTGEMHYPRIPRAQWRDAMLKAKALGLNTITTYVFWNVHEPKPGVYDFTGQNDLGAFLKTAQDAGLNVVLRPGPYACAEWEFGGYPSWLLKDPATVVRSTDPRFMESATRWFHKLGEVVKPYLAGYGGPIIAVQVENEYGSFDKDHAYMDRIKKLVIESGMGGPLTGVMLYTADGGVQQKDGSLPDLPNGVNFGPGMSKGEFEKYETFRPKGIRFVSEYWAGWFDHWGDNHQNTNAMQQVKEYEAMLQRGYSVNLYMLYGGTSFGWMNGANSGGTAHYQPDVTSYDYDGPIDERGNPTPKYYALRDVITKITGVAPPPVPETRPTELYPIEATRQAASLWKNLPKPVRSDRTLTMEDLNQSYGYILYTTQLQPKQQGELVFDELHDYAQVYLDHVLVGTVDRRLNQGSIMLPTSDKTRELEILVENSGRINFTRAIRQERKGITHRALLNNVELSGWKIYSLPLEKPELLHFSKNACAGPCFYRLTLTTNKKLRYPADTFLQTTALHKGFVWVNGTPLGRAWNVGPQAALFTPGSWLQPGANSIVALDLLGEGIPQLTTRTDALYIPGKDARPARIKKPEPKP